jgi:alpha-ribazole phosphatase
MTKLILIRHGQTNSNLEKRYSGTIDSPLNENGIKQCEALHLKLKDIVIDKVYSSDLQRAVHSASIIFKDLLIKKEPAFREMNFGIFEGLTYDEIMKKYADCYTNWIDNFADCMIPEGESILSLKDRVIPRLNSIITENKGKTIALLSHGGIIRVILCYVLNYGAEKFWEMEQDNCALNIIDYVEDESPKVIKMNEVIL